MYIVHKVSLIQNTREREREGGGGEREKGRESVGSSVEILCTCIYQHVCTACKCSTL